MDIDPLDVEPTGEERAEYRRETILSIGMDPDTLVIPAQPTEEQDAEALRQQAEAQAQPSETEKEQRASEQEQLSDTVSTLLQAASAADRAEEESRLSLSPTTERKKASRPYDAIRDVFTESTPPAPPALAYPMTSPFPAPAAFPLMNPGHASSLPTQASTSAFDASRLDILADTATGRYSDMPQVITNNAPPPPPALYPGELHAVPQGGYNPGGPQGGFIPGLRQSFKEVPIPNRHYQTMP